MHCSSGIRYWQTPYYLRSYSAIEVLEVATIKLCKFDYIRRFSPAENLAHSFSVTRSIKLATGRMGNSVLSRLFVNGHTEHLVLYHSLFILV